MCASALSVCMCVSACVSLCVCECVLLIDSCRVIWSQCTAGKSEEDTKTTGESSECRGSCKDQQEEDGGSTKGKLQVTDS